VTLPVRLTAAQARRIAVAAQGFSEPRPSGPITRGHLKRLMSRIQVLQLDSVSVAVRAQYAPVFSRFGPYDRDVLDSAAWGPRSSRLLAEYWAHEAALMAVDDWPLLRWRMRQYRHGRWGTHIVKANPQLAEDIVAAVAELGPSTAGQIEAQGWLAQAVRLDVTNKDEIESVIDRIVKESGKIDNLINCAGIGYNKPFMESSDDEFRKTLEVNLIGANNCCQASLKKMIPRKEGKIVNILSASSRQGSDFFTHYSSSKFGLLGLTQGIGMAAARHNINVNGICPGIIETKIGEKQGGGLVKQMAKYSGKPEELLREGIRKTIPFLPQAGHSTFS